VSIEISVVICTYNRASYLVKALESLQLQSVPLDSFEIIVVDNHSNDNTKDIVNRFQLELSNLIYIYEPSQGLSIARNCGIKAARSEIIIFIDDDAVACPDLIDYHLKAYKEIHPRPGCVAGKILLDWELPKPDWFPNNRLFERALTYLDYGQEPRFIDFTKYEYPFGANMSFLKSALSDIGGFKNNLGRRGNNLLSNEESHVIYSLFKNDYKIYYEPRSYVYHKVTKERISKKFFYKRFYWQGISNAIWYPEEMKQKKQFITSCKVLAKTSVDFLRLYLKNQNGKTDRFEKLCTIYFNAGFILQKVLRLKR